MQVFSSEVQEELLLGESQKSRAVARAYFKFRRKSNSHIIFIQKDARAQLQ
jgi:hypothetical protein